MLVTECDVRNDKMSGEGFNKVGKWSPRLLSERDFQRFRFSPGYFSYEDIVQKMCLLGLIKPTCISYTEYIMI